MKQYLLSELSGINYARTSYIHTQQDPKWVAVYWITSIWKVRGQRSHTEPCKSQQCNLMSFPCPEQFSMQLLQKRLMAIAAASRGEMHDMEAQPIFHLWFVTSHYNKTTAIYNLQCWQFTIQMSALIFQRMDCVHISQYDTEMPGQVHFKCTFYLILLTNHYHYFCCLRMQYLLGKM